MYEKQTQQKSTSSKAKPLYIKLSTGLADVHLGALVDSVPEVSTAITNVCLGDRCGQRNNLRNHRISVKEHGYVQNADGLCNNG
jgi:hypothetical protein